MLAESIQAVLDIRFKTTVLLRHKSELIQVSVSLPKEAAIDQIHRDYGEYTVIGITSEKMWV